MSAGTTDQARLPTADSCQTSVAQASGKWYGLWTEIEGAGLFISNVLGLSPCRGSLNIRLQRLFDLLDMSLHLGHTLKLDE